MCDRSNTIIIAMVSLCLPLLLACSKDSYDDGNGRYSFLQADFVEAPAQRHAITFAVTDAGDTLHFASPFTAPWLVNRDTLYRALLYHQPSSATKIAVNQLTPIAVLPYIPQHRFRTLRTDPVIFESAWLSKHRQYLNIGLALKTGQQENSMQSQHLSIIEMDSVSTGGQLQFIHLQLYHDQGGVPEYYSTHGYISIPIRHLPRGCHIRLSMMTYQGYIYRNFIL